MDGRELIKLLNDQVPDLIGTKAVASILGVAPSNIDRVPDLPEAAQDADRGRLWRRDVIELFARERG